MKLYTNVPLFELQRDVFAKFVLLALLESRFCVMVK